MILDLVKKILLAESSIYDLVVETPLDLARNISSRCNNTVFIKREDMQPIFSFKLRGAYNCLLNIPEDLRSKGVVTASAGNHAQGVSLASKKLGIPAWIVMPVSTPEIKIEAVRTLGAEVVLSGDSVDDSVILAKSMSEEKQLSYIPPFDNEFVMAGQGTVSIECLRQAQGRIDMIFIPVGGGGLLAGMAAYIKFVSPGTKVIGVEFEESACLKESLATGKRITLDKVGTFADGVAVKQIGRHPYEAICGLVDDVITVNKEEICAAIKDIYKDTRAIPEPSGAISIAGLKKFVKERGIRGLQLIAVLSGSNLNFESLRYVSERAMIGEKREALFCVKLKSEHNSFRKLVGALNGKIFTEISYRSVGENVSNALVGVRCEPHGDNSTSSLDLEGLGYAAIEVSHDNVTAVHIRNMIGGKGRVAGNELIFQVELPERRGSLMSFLSQVSEMEITLFHYRNLGSSFSSVLVGFDSIPHCRDHMLSCLISTGFSFTEESSNESYKAFLQ